MVMQQFLDEIKTTPGVLGSVIYTTKKGVIATNLPEIFKAETQKRIGSILQRVFMLNETVKLDVNLFEFQYEEALLLVRQLCKDSALIIICEPDANAHLINMTISMLTAEMMNNMEDCEKPPEPPPMAEPEDILNGPLAEDLSRIKRALAQHIGPIAGTILTKRIKEWQEITTPDKSNFDKLTEILLREIDDQESKQSFLEEIKLII